MFLMVFMISMLIMMFEIVVWLFISDMLLSMYVEIMFSLKFCVVFGWFDVMCDVRIMFVRVVIVFWIRKMYMCVCLMLIFVSCDVFGLLLIVSVLWLYMVWFSSMLKLMKYSSVI